MSIKVEKTDNKNELKLEFTVAAEKFEDAMKKVYFQTAKYFNIPGFRKGKAPMKIVEKYYGESIFYEDAFNEILKEEYDKDVPEGYIISQDPSYVENYNKVKKGSTVKVVVSKGQEKTTVPKVVGMQKDEAIKALEDAKLKVEVVEETSKKVEEGYVISQETDQNTDAFAGDTVKIHVSTGTEKVTVPDVVGKTQAEAKKALEAQGFVVSITNADGDKYEFK